jgi:hypothetical protein
MGFSREYKPMGLLLHANSGTLMMRFLEKQPTGITLFL